MHQPQLRFVRVIVAVRVPLFPGAIVIELGEMVSDPIPGGEDIVKSNVFVTEATPLPLARTVCVVVPRVTLVLAVKVMDPVLPVPGLE